MFRISVLVEDVYEAHQSPSNPWETRATQPDLAEQARLDATESKAPDESLIKSPFWVWGWNWTLIFAPQHWWSVGDLESNSHTREHTAFTYFVVA
jgi:hypothetical protein